MTPLTEGDNKNWQWLAIKVFYGGSKNTSQSKRYKRSRKEYQVTLKGIKGVEKSTRQTFLEASEPDLNLLVPAETITTKKHNRLVS